MKTRPYSEIFGLKRQRGASMPLIVFILGVLGFGGICAFKLGPNYFEYMTIRKIATDTASNSELMSGPPSKVYTYLDNAFRTNNLWDVTPKDVIQLEKANRGTGYMVKVQYEKRTPLLSNIEVVTVFNKVATP